MLLNAMRALGYCCVPEVARAIIKARLDSGLSPRPQSVEFANSIFDADVANYQIAPSSGVCFFDRGVVDALGMQHLCNTLSEDEIDLNLRRYSYNRVVFLFPPWEEIYQTDGERDQSFAESVRVFKSVKSWYSRCGYQIQEVPIGTLNERVAFIERSVATASTI